jgi:hypothetical protein
MEELFDFSNELECWNLKAINDILKDTGNSFSLKYCELKSHRYMQICNSLGNPILFIYEESTMRIYKDGSIVLWLGDKNKNGIAIYKINLNKLNELNDFEKEYYDFRIQSAYTNIWAKCMDELIYLNVEELPSGIHKIKAPSEMKGLSEVLAFSQFILGEKDITNRIGSRTALYCVDFSNDEVSVYPQVWLNIDESDFGHFYPLQAKRNSDKTISIRGDGFWPFVLDETNTYSKDSINRDVKLR